MKQEPPYTVPETATVLNLSVPTIRSWIAQGRIGHIRLGRAIRVPVSEPARLLEEGFTPARRKG